MKYNDILKLLITLSKVKFCGKKIPLLVSWALTSRCNLRCVYCGVWETPQKELSTDVVIEKIVDFFQLGTRFISFTGGEPLLRDDLGKIIAYCKKKGIYVSVSSNGWDVKKKIDSLQKVDLLSLSIEGNRSVHDTIRQEGSYDKVLEAAECARRHNIPLNFAATLTRLNLDQIDFLLTTAQSYQATITFQPLTTSLLYCAHQDNPLLPSFEEYSAAIKKLLILKKKNIYITNSSACLRHFAHWPGPYPLRCRADYFSCRVQSSGDVCVCNRNQKTRINIVDNGVAEAFQRLVAGHCSSCWCAQRVEMSLLYGLHPEAIWNTGRMVLRKVV
ncbi:MAG: radical SAM protein [Candidatus Omnitrophica bacterium]|nr:radical SAM protein [Candidatus Omnitrophota bacterium]